MSCVFCQIRDKQIPASFVYEDEKAAAFLDIHPINEGHVLVVLKRHAERFCDLSEDEASSLFKVGRKILKAIQDSGIKCDGANLFLSDGPIAGQEVMHTHLHIAPRFQGDGQRVGFKHADSDQYPRARLDQIATAIADHLSTPIEVKTVTQPTLKTQRLILKS